jgi:CelD/BcsL family acetyltransferase involved in cellulose biosynthesis
MNNLTILDPLRDPRWDQLVESHSASSIYQHSAWLRVIAQTYPHLTLTAYAKEKEGRLIAALPACIVRSRLTGTRIVSLPFTPYCNPIAEGPSEAAALLEGPIQTLAADQASFYELRTLGTAEWFDERTMKRHDYHMAHLLDLEGGFEQVRRNFSPNIVTNRKKAVKAGVTVRSAASAADWDAFYQIHAMTRRNQGFPIQPAVLFQNMRRCMEPDGKVKLLLAEMTGRPIAGIILFQFRDKVSYEIGASLPEFLNARSNHLLLWTAVETACAEGRRCFNFGKSPPDNPGLIEFKRRWGTVSHVCPYYYYPRISGAMAVEQKSIKHRAMRLFLSQVPLPFARLLGRGLYRHMG